MPLRLENGVCQRNAVRRRLKDVGFCGCMGFLILILQLASFAAAQERTVPAECDARALRLCCS